MCASNEAIEKVNENTFEVLTYSAELSETITLDISEIVLGKPKEYKYWTKNYQNPQNNIAHIKTSASFRDKKKIFSGSSNYINLIQPIYFEGILCHVQKKGFLVCKRVEDKEEVINIDIKNDGIEKYEVVRGGITYFDNTIIFVDAYGQIKSIDVDNSKINWETQIDFPILSAPLIYRDQVFFISADNRIFSLSFKTGEIQWSFQTIEESKKNLFTASPVAIENIIIAPFSNGEIIAFKVDDGQPVWSENTSKISIISNFNLRDITANPVISGNSIFSLSSNGRLISNSIINGARNWNVDISGSQTPIISANQIYLIDNEARVICINKSTGEIYWIRELEKYRRGTDSKNLNLWTGPYLINEYLYLISYFGDILTISPLNGEVLDEDKLGVKNIYSPLIVLSDQIFITDEKANIYRFK
jgi:outer membrane protein assembly factor BamB